MFFYVYLGAKIMNFPMLQVYLTKKGDPKASFFDLPKTLDYFTTSLMVLLKPLALMLQK